MPSIHECPRCGKWIIGEPWPHCCWECRSSHPISARWHEVHQRWLDWLRNRIYR